ncbi:FMN-linked oxidoreductase [Pleurotus eryngii]|uniref:FMN-linked oxidoreductase n=1 Tax=Pleurotus eryngii TaxID=5323 RepID=A0A9P5ZZ82_PLEER|nr:FMN-linked oxidoreductase [Pleurotus eryngii]
MSCDGRTSIFSPVTLPCGKVVPNRLVKVAMYEHLAALWGGPPNSYHFSLYSQWARAGWGMVLTGNFQVSGEHLTLGRDVVIPREITDATLKPFIRLADAMHESGQSLAIMQLSHSGRQSTNLIGGRWPFVPPRAPSPIRVGSSVSSGYLADVFHWLCFQTPDPLSVAEIDDVVEAFARGARVAAQSGFDGIELHAAHGYLLAQFLSPKTNLRSDEYSAENGLRIVHQILSKIREEVSPQFIVGIKLNAADYASSGSEDRALQHVRELAASRLVDFIEISGGDYENPEFTSTSASTSSRQALFTRFSREAVLTVAANVKTPPLILLTGGFSSLAQLDTALDSRHADLLGIGRFSIICPDLPLTLRQNVHSRNSQFSSRPSIESADPTELNGNPAFSWLWKQVRKFKLVGAGAGIAWYTLTLRELARRHTTAVTVSKEMGVVRAVCGMWLWLGPASPSNGPIIFALSLFALSIALFWIEGYRMFSLVF